MKHWLGAFALLLIAACMPPQTGAEAVVREIYATAQQNIGTSVTPLSAIPMSEDLRALVERAEAAATARDEPFIEGDLAANCQDCQSLSDLEIGPQEGPEAIPADDGHVIIEARFKLNGTEDRAVLYDLVQTAEGWRVDNILAEGFNLRSEAAAFLVDAAAEPAEPAAP
jgi:hypothetical protein